MNIVTTAPSPAFYVAIVGYILASLMLVSTFSVGKTWVEKGARVLLFLAFLAHAVDIGWRGVEGVHPGTSVRESLGFLGWVFVGGYLLVIRRGGFAALGSIVAPLSVVLLAAARLSPSGKALPELSSLGRLHIATATVGLAVFALATAVSVIYLLQERNLKRKKFDGVLFKITAALETLDRMASRLNAVGFPIFTLSMCLGGIWLVQRGQGLTRIEHPIAIITWCVFGVLVVGRQAGHLRGRRAARATVGGFGAAMLVVLIYFLRRSVGL